MYISCQCELFTLLFYDWWIIKDLCYCLSLMSNCEVEKCNVALYWLDVQNASNVNLPHFLSLNLNVRIFGTSMKLEEII